MKKNDHILFFSTALVVAASLAFAEFGIEKIPMYFAFFLLVVSVIALTRAEKEFTFHWRFLWQMSYLLFYLVCFFFFLSLFEKNDEIYSALINLITINKAVNIITMAFGVAVCEEIFFRKFLMNLLIEFTSKKAALIYTSLAFYFAHFSILPYTFFLGILFGWIVLQYKSIVGAVFLHAIYDIISFTQINLSSNDTIDISLTNSLQAANIFAISTVFFAVVLKVVLAKLMVTIRRYVKSTAS
jgi:membrane protease YdiL (CAAX protease family)